MSLRVFVTTWMGKKLSSNSLSTQLSNALSNFICFGFFFKSGNSLCETSVQFRMKFIGAETRADLEVQYMYEYVSSDEFQHCDYVTSIYGIAIVINNSKNWPCS